MKRALPERASVEPAVPRRRARLFAAFKFRDFRLLWVGLFVSNFGTWMQFTALGYLVVTLAPSPRLGSLYLGFLGASRAVPVLLCSPVAGFAADRYSRRAILLLANGVLSLLGLALAIGTSTHALSIGGILAISALQSAAASFDAPARQSWVPLMVTREYVGNAIGLNSIAFNAPSIIGPAIAGFLIASVSVATAFYLNAALTLAVIMAVWMMSDAPPSMTSGESMLASIAEGLRFLLSHPVLRWIVLVLVISSFLVRPFVQLLPAYALHSLHGDARGLGWLMAANGIGAFAGALTSAIYTGQRRGRMWFAAAAIMSVSLIALGAVANFWLAFAILVVTGGATMSFINSSNVLIQTLAPEEMRGRAISVYSMVLLGLVPLGTLVLGALGSLAGLHVALETGGAVTAIVVLWIWARRPLRTV